MAKAAEKLLQVRLRSPYENYFSGAAVSLSATNRLGPLDILPDHAPFFSLLTPGTITVRTANEKLEFKIQNGILKIKNNQVDVFTNI